MDSSIQVNAKWAKDNWDKHSIYAYSFNQCVDWVVTSIEEIDNLEEDTMLFINN